MARKKVLQDHKRHGKTLIPPFTHLLGPLREVSWVKTILPELLWIALIQDRYGHHMGVELITVTARAARQVAPSTTSSIFGTISSFDALTPTQQEALRSALAESGHLFQIQEALLPLIILYPCCPMRLLFSVTTSEADANTHHLHRLKTLIGNMYDRGSRATMMVQATFVWLAFDAGALQVHEGLALAEFPEIESYPHTELSKRIASGVRAVLHAFFDNSDDQASSDWPRYFWNRGLEIDPCYCQDESYV
jgi:hypothetical protein